MCRKRSRRRSCPSSTPAGFSSARPGRFSNLASLSTGSRPMWLWGNGVTLRRDPLGVVLIIGPSNYPLMLPGVQILQAVAAGNGVLVEPAPGCSRPIEMLVGLMESAGLPPGLIQLLPESPDAATAAIPAGVDKVFLTGSAPAGRAVSRDLAEGTIPSDDGALRLRRRLRSRRCRSGARQRQPAVRVSR